MIGPHLHAGPRLAADRERHEVEVAEPAHAQLGQQPAGRESTGHGDAGIEDAGPTRQRVRAEAQLLRSADARHRPAPTRARSSHIGHADRLVSVVVVIALRRSTRAMTGSAYSRGYTGGAFPGRAVRTHSFCLFAVVSGVPLSRPSAQVRLADDTDRAAFRSWFVLLADAQFERPAAEVTDCAALVRFAMREALRAHTPEWARTRRVAVHAAVSRRSIGAARRRRTAAALPRRRAGRAALRRVRRRADHRVDSTRGRSGATPAGAQPGDLLYFRQPGQRQPDHLMVFVGRSHFEPEGADWVVYHTGPLRTRSRRGAQGAPGDAARSIPAPRWRPVARQPAVRRRLPSGRLVTS